MPSADSNIRIEVWLPLQGWNGRLLGEGNGGFAGDIGYRELTTGVQQGFATATTDMGTSSSMPIQADALIGHPEKWKDWGFRATHVMTVLSKEVIHAFYRTSPRYSYFRGCSTGGQQGLAEAQRFPNDYDGVLSGAPANARTRLHDAILWNHSVLSKGVTAGLTPAKLMLLSKAVLRTCGTHTGEVGSLQIQDPQACEFDPRPLLCKQNETMNCLNQSEIEAVNQVYDGPKNQWGQTLYPGLSRGSEAEWSLPSTTKENDEVPYASIFKWVWGASWNWRSFDFDQDVATMDRRLGPFVNATNPNLSKFERRGHKLLMYHGWADPLIAPMGSIRYFEDVLETEHAVTGTTEPDALERTETYLRLFMIPGMAHCGGGKGPEHLNLLPLLQAWVEKDIAPAEISIINATVEGSVRTQSLCPYPQVAHATAQANRYVCGK